MDTTTGPEQPIQRWEPSRFNIGSMDRVINGEWVRWADVAHLIQGPAGSTNGEARARAMLDEVARENASLPHPRGPGFLGGSDREPTDEEIAATGRFLCQCGHMEAEHIWVEFAMDEFEYRCPACKLVCVPLSAGVAASTGEAAIRADERALWPDDGEHHFACPVWKQCREWDRDGDNDGAPTAIDDEHDATEPGARCPHCGAWCICDRISKALAAAPPVSGSPDPPWGAPYESLSDEHKAGVGKILDAMQALAVGDRVERVLGAPGPYRDCVGTIVRCGAETDPHPWIVRWDRIGTDFYYSADELRPVSGSPQPTDEPNAECGWCGRMIDLRREGHAVKDGNWHYHLGDCWDAECGTGPRPKIVCLCGSTRFSEAWIKARYDLTLAGEIVLTIGNDTKSDDALQLTDEQKVALDALHKRKIDLADYVLVLNVGGYIGDSTRSEIEYAEAHGKPVTYLEPAVSGSTEAAECECPDVDLSGHLGDCPRFLAALGLGSTETPTGLRCAKCGQSERTCAWGGGRCCEVCEHRVETPIGGQR